MAASGYQRPTSLFEKPSDQADFVLRAKTGCQVFSLEGDPTLPGCGPLTVPYPFQVLRLNVLAIIIIIILSKITRGRRKIFLKKRAGSER
jgi:hypothetical protein